MIKLTEKHIIHLHEMLIDETGGSYGLRDRSLLISALDTPFQTFDSIDLYPTIESKAARLAFGMIKNHPFVDGNKRIGLFAMLVFLEINNILLEYTQNELITVGLGLADSSLTENELLVFINKHKK